MVWHYEIDKLDWIIMTQILLPGIILCVHPANGRRRYIVTLSNWSLIAVISHSLFDSKSLSGDQFLFSADIIIVLTHYMLIKCGET